jgi:2-polyprenyl-3-methyl-5-hydroxy-6-metoxy-1,4-benzoquinol methylase
VIASHAVPAGNVYDKYATRNPLARGLVAGYRAALVELVELAAPESLIDVGCGEGVLSAGLADRVDGPVLAVDSGASALAAHWAANAAPNLRYRRADATALPAPDGAYDAASALEVLEHLRGPDAALAEMRRVARRWLIASVPREPVWRAANVARGAYLDALGNTPGHVNHWSRRAFLAMLSGHGEVVDVRSPPPWTMALVRVEP